MIKRFREGFPGGIFQKHVEQGSPLNYEGIAISDKAKSLLEKNLSRESRVCILDSFRSLQETYQSPELMVERLTEKPILRITKGFILSSSLTPIANYYLQVPFDPRQRDSGECGEIVRWFLHDMQAPMIHADMDRQKLNLNIALGKSPQFFTEEASNHVMASLTDNRGKWEVVFDPSFGTIFSIDEQTGYRIEERENIRGIEENLFRKKTHEVGGWEEPLKHGTTCPTQYDPESPESRLLGISRDKTRMYSLGFETQNDRPFLCVTYPAGDRLDILWYDESLQTKGNIGIMSSDPSQASIDTYPLTDEIFTMLQSFKHFRFEECDITDPRLDREIIM